MRYNKQKWWCCIKKLNYYFKVFCQGNVNLQLSTIPKHQCLVQQLWNSPQTPDLKLLHTCKGGNICQAKKKNLNSNADCSSFFHSGWFELQHPRWYWIFLWSHQSVWEFREHDHNVFNKGLLLWQAGGWKSWGKNSFIQFEETKI